MGEQVRRTSLVDSPVSRAAVIATAADEFEACARRRMGRRVRQKSKFSISCSKVWMGDGKMGRAQRLGDSIQQRKMMYLIMLLLIYLGIL